MTLHRKTDVGDLYSADHVALLLLYEIQAQQHPELMDAVLVVRVASLSAPRSVFDFARSRQQYVVDVEAHSRWYGRRIVRVAHVKARLAPWLNEPYFTVITVWQTTALKRCTHVDFGVTLDIVNRQAICKGCQQPVDPFDALLHYAESEQRLVRTLHEIHAIDQREQEKAAREQARRPFRRTVVTRVPIRDLTLKAEPIVGYHNTLECHHVVETHGDRRRHTLTCAECQRAVQNKHP